MYFSKVLNWIAVGILSAQLPLLAVQGSFATPAPTVAAPTTTPVPTTKPTTPTNKTTLSRTNKYGFSCTNTTTTLLIKKGTQRLKKVPLIKWTEAGAEEFGDNYSAESRCKIVTARFKRLMIVQKTKLRTPLPPIRVGELNGMKVICASRGACTGKNLLWTLKSQNAANAKRVLGQLVLVIKNPSLATGRATIFESPDTPDSQLESLDVVDTEELLATAVSNYESSDRADLESEDQAELESEDQAELESEDQAELESEDQAELESGNDITNEM